MTHSKLKSIRLFALMLLVLAMLVLAACGSGMGQPKTYTIGIVHNAPILAPVIEGFKTGMADLGYVEGENVIYIDNGVTEADPQALDAEIENLLAQDVDLLFPVGNPAAVQAKQAVAGTDMPVVFGAVTDPIGAGLVEGIAQPGGNLTGTQTGTEFAAALGWLVKLTPGADKVYLPYNPDDPLAMVGMAILEGAPEKLGIEVVRDEVGSADEAAAAIESLPEDIDGVFLLPSPTLTINSDEIVQAAVNRNLPIGSPVPLEGALFFLGADLFDVGKQTARIADQVFKGLKPADLPVETAEFYLTINLKTAEAIGLDISDDLLRQANEVIR